MSQLGCGPDADLVVLSDSSAQIITDFGRGSSLMLPLVRHVPYMLLLPGHRCDWAQPTNVLRMLLCICSCIWISMALQQMASQFSDQIGPKKCMVWLCRLLWPRQMEGSPDRRTTSQTKKSGTQLVGKKCQIW